MLGDDASTDAGSALSAILGRIGDRWTFPAISLIGGGPRPLGEVRRALPGITQRALMLTLQALERDGLASRIADPDTPTRVLYALSDRGRLLLPMLTALADWAGRNRDGIERSRRDFDRAQAERAAVLVRELARQR